MKAAHRTRVDARHSAIVVISLLLVVNSSSAVAQSTQLVLEHGAQTEHSGEYKGVVDLAIDPGFDNAKVTMRVGETRVLRGQAAEPPRPAAS